jgi:hypothetical protein
MQVVIDIDLFAAQIAMAFTAMLPTLNSLTLLGSLITMYAYFQRRQI